MAMNALNTRSGLLVSLVMIMLAAASGWADTASQLSTKQQGNEKQTLFAKFDSPPVSNETKKLAEELIQKAVLAEDWEGIVNMLSGVSDANLPVEYRMVKGHACLATNRNNESLCLFLSVTSKDELQEWQKWSENFAKKYPNSPIAHYFVGDSSARLKNWDQAVTEFNTSLVTEPNNVLAMHSRAVVTALNGKYDEARRDMNRCMAIAPQFAEVYVSWGTYIVQRKTDPKKALEAFDRALKYSPEYVLALNGKGGMETITGDLNTAAEHLQQAKDISINCLSGLSAIVNLNIAVLGTKINEDMDKRIAKATGINPGMTLDEKMQKFGSLPLQQKQAVIDSAANAANFNRTRLGDISTPDSFKTNSQLNGEIGFKGTVPFGKIGGSTGIEIYTDISGKTSYNVKNQEDFLKSAQQKYGLSPSSGYNSFGNDIKSFINNQIGIGSDFSHSGGVSSEQIGETLDVGDWKVLTIYGIVYMNDIELPKVKEN